MTMSLTRLSDILGLHLQSVANLYCNVTPGENMSNSETRTEGESLLWNEMAKGLGDLKENILDLARPRCIQVKIGWPKPAWAHIYYVSFHDPANSRGPTEGFYPVFLMSTDQQVCWLSVCLAAASVGISGRGGWSNIRGELLKRRAGLLSATLKEKDGWQKGPIKLGTNFSYLHQEKGATHNTGRAYECGAIISKSFNPHNPPDNLSKWLTSAFRFYDELLSLESAYIETSLPPVSEDEWKEQISASVTGGKAERYFLEKWCHNVRPEWGSPVDKTISTGLGYDFEFPQVGLYVEVKGFRGGIEDIRLTKREWDRAKEKGNKFILCLVSNINSDREPKVDLIIDPYRELSSGVSKNMRIQITYSISRRQLRDKI
jgi:Domain of unknown function (DUF3883)/MrcB-like, N-terminal domain